MKRIVFDLQQVLSIGVILALATGTSSGQATLPDGGKPGGSAAPASRPADDSADSKRADEKKKEDTKERSFYIGSKAASCAPENDPGAGDGYLKQPWYVKTVDKLAPGLEEYKWLQLGVEQRTRFEYRDDDYRKSRLTRDTPFLMRNRAFLGVTEILDPFRAVVEFQDSRIFNTRFPETNTDVDENEILQLYGELFFKDALGDNEPFRIRYGRMTIDEGDRMLVHRNAFGNATTSFEGFRMTFGQATSLWELDTIFVQPVVRQVHQWNHADEERWLYGMVFDWRGWSPWLILEPFYYILDEDHERHENTNPKDREIHTMGLRTYGVWKNGFDYDTDVMFQFGEDGEQNQHGFGMHSEVGYTFAHDWKPRFSLLAAYASGDRDPTDDDQERFDRMFGTSDWLGTINYYTLQNLIRTQAKFQVLPIKQVRMETYYNATWLAHNADGWVQVGRKDASGSAGTFVGQEVGAQIRWQIDPRVELTVAYVHFMQGNFVDHSGPADDSDFFYVQTTCQLFK